MNAPPIEHVEKTLTTIQAAVAAIPKDKSGVFTVWVDTSLGVNAAAVQRVNDNVKVIAWFGKKWGEPIRAGVATQIEW